MPEVARDALLAYAAVRIKNCQVRVFLAYARPQETALLDRGFYLPEGWTNELARLWAVGLAPNTPFATKSQLTRSLGDEGHGLRPLGNPAAVAGGAGAILRAGGASRVNNGHFATDRSLL